MPQSWQCEIEVYKATYHFIYAQKNFFTGEWGKPKSNKASDFMSFVIKSVSCCEIKLLEISFLFVRSLITLPSVFVDLIRDWASDSAPDIYSFVPYSWKFKILFHQFEMIWAANQHNWIDCSTKQQENGKTWDEKLPEQQYLLKRFHRGICIRCFILWVGCLKPNQGSCFLIVTFKFFNRANPGWPGS